MQDIFFVRDPTWRFPESVLELQWVKGLSLIGFFMDYLYHMNNR